MNGRNQSLDVLRCVAVLLVIGYHLPHYRLWARAGWIGVDLFFVLSGFLISGLLFSDYQAHGRIDWKRFLIRRGFKIWPPFYIFLAVTAVIFVGHSVANRRGVLASALFLQNYLPKSPIVASGMYVHLWSLAVEEHFYLMLPALLIFLASRNRGSDPFRLLPLFFVVTAAACLALRALTLPDGDVAQMTHLRIDSLFAGVTLGYLQRFRYDLFRRLAGGWALVLGLLLCSPALFFDRETRFMETVGLTGLLLGFSLIVGWAVDARPKSWIGSRLAEVAARIGFYSYSIYLWHVYAVSMLGAHSASAFAFWGAVAYAVMLGYAMAAMIEAPALRLRNLLFPVPAQPVPLALGNADEVPGVASLGGEAALRAG